MMLAVREALIQRLRAWLEDAPGPWPLPPGITGLGGRHRLNGLLYHIGDLADELERAQAQRAWTTNLAGHMARLQVFAEVWPKGALPPLLIKGGDLAERLYPNAGCRAADDLDLLVPLADFPRLARALEAQADEVRVPRYERYAHERPHNLGFLFGDVLLELHHAPQPTHRARLGGYELWLRSTPAEVAGRSVRLPSPTDRLLIWLSNRAKGAFFADLRDWLEGALLIKAAASVDLASAAERAELGRAWRFALARLDAEGLGYAPTRGLPSVLARHLPSEVTATTPAVFQAVKWSVGSNAARRAMLTRGLATLLRRRSEP